MDRVVPSSIRYIKLGAGGRWEASSLDLSRLQWGMASDPHDFAAQRDWPALNQSYPYFPVKSCQSVAGPGSKVSSTPDVHTSSAYP